MNRTPLVPAVICVAAVSLGTFALAQQDPGMPGSAPPATPAPGGMDHPNMGGPGGMNRMMRPHDQMLAEIFGAMFRPLPREQAKANDVKPGVGLVVESVKAGSSAETGGLKRGDVLFKVGDQWVINTGQLATLLAIQDPDSNVELKVRRGSERVDLDFKFDKAALEAMGAALQTMGGMERGMRGQDMPPRGDMNGGAPPAPPAGGMGNP